MNVEKVGEGFWAGLGVGAILAFIVNLFIVWGGHPRGMFWRIDDNKKEIVILQTKDKKTLEVFNEHRHEGIYGPVKR